MDIDDDDDFYAPEEPTTQAVDNASAPGLVVTSTTTSTEPLKQQQQQDGDLEEGEEEDEGAEMEDSDSDIDIITERKDGTKAAPPTQSRYSDIRNIPQRSTSADTSTKPPVKKDESSTGTSGAELPPVSTSTIDVHGVPIYNPVGKPITQVNIDQDLPENDKPWRKPGTDLSDYFNYGFDEFTWALYAAKQDNVRAEYSQDAIAQNQKKMMEEMQMMMMGGMPGMGGAGATGSMSGMPGMDGMPPEFQAMMQQMMASGMDPSQMDPSAMTAMFSGMQNSAGGGVAGQGGQNQNFGAGGAGNQGQNFGYDQGMGRGGGGGFGRGRGGRRNW
ncbi:Fip1 motif-domain-containing protein [Xylaria bambusicola]|uniref:Fip1 motif-domain-containing protein n=1 Tax=Xylaria bambusicola TaxID=326684 RepID=UPI002007CEEE|nr:Fip1 motif-domain-containing protein [Xylaria bambusicola]KAI0508711.1 Fip1 motif-domain-containing protein [Xylaria bambusicola]